MANSINAAFTKSKTDELYTPKILTDIIWPYFNGFVYEFRKKHNRSPIILMPFDTKNSEFVLSFYERYGKDLYELKFGHISTGQDFFTYDYGDYDIVISNPPFSRKLDIFKKLIELDKSFALICNVMCLNYMEIGNYFADHKGLQLIIPDKRISFNGNPSSFNSAYFCYNFTKKDLQFCHLPHCNSGKNYTPSRMYK